jgi:hypothetical protein
VHSPTLDMAALTPAQRDVLGLIAINQDAGHHPATLAALAQRGLIVGYRQTLPGFPPVEITRWEVPVDVHIQWAEWCAAQPDEEAEADG